MNVNRLTTILAPKNRGRLFDVLIFLLNLFLLRVLVRIFLDIARRAAAGDLFARFGLLVFYSGMLILPSLGAILKRWHFHQRIKERGEAEDADGCLPFGCIFIPAAYLMVNMCVTLGVSLSLLDLFPGSTMSGAFLLIGLPYNVFQTVLVFRYFSPPNRKPKLKFLISQRSDALGDACILLNLILYQILLSWAVVVFPGFHEGRFVDRFIPMVIFTLLIYISGRIFFLVEDIRHPRTWLTILLANSLMILRAVFARA